MKKKDEQNRKNIAVFAGIAILILLTFLIRSFLFQGEADYVEISVNDEVFGIYSLNQDQDIRVELPGGGYNIVKIQSGKVCVDEANCPGRDCVRQGWILRSGESVICLPHRLVIQIKGEQEPEYDAVSQ